MTTYRIVRFYSDYSRPNKTLLTGLTLEQAKAHCQRVDTAGDGWFDGFVREDHTHTWDSTPEKGWHCTTCGQAIAGGSMSD